MAEKDITQNVLDYCTGSFEVFKPYMEDIDVKDLDDEMINLFYEGVKHKEPQLLPRAKKFIRLVLKQSSSRSPQGKIRD